MSDAMVTARMSAEKKEAGNRVLEQLGTNASQAVNRLYDYVLEKKELPFPEQQERRKYTQEEIARAIAWVDSIPRKDRFSTMTDDEIRRERLASRGLATRGDFS
ncbi:type II toxin-antitoxin system RelB/DinJ family antitoxin [Gordonibacter massiliensis (ex Traore et al. 2017)]|uniref:type II toxin-antitoxin system RelB/DinJ family antitoxin n=1 Tax=Gordonibacter massiliensis (ex Traore et al. 2017) TaxID=1841863 RepID=UPI001C8B3F52|nr:type II toxin-antitoxin system RelB/DinJ family antitoxin [Gordonibacter massiliensis (ex Traore et al. 2017)]MBX9032991.1 RelB/DinJ family addiction module antitoxin [Gordonibacter massiliensis (ex Traore et al. 2017)]